MTDFWKVSLCFFAVTLFSLSLSLLVYFKCSQVRRNFGNNYIEDIVSFDGLGGNIITSSIYILHLHITSTYYIYILHIHIASTYYIYILHLHYYIYILHLHITSTYYIHILHLHITYTYYILLWTSSCSGEIDRTLRKESRPCGVFLFSIRFWLVSSEIIVSIRS